VLPINRPPIKDGWIQTDAGRILAVGSGRPPGNPVDLGEVAILPGLVNAHTHLELSWMAELVPPAPSMNDWIRTLLRVRRAGPPGGPEAADRAARDAAASMAATGTLLVGDISNGLTTTRVMADAGLGGVVFHEVLGFSAIDPLRLVRDAWDHVGREASLLDGGIDARHPAGSGAPPIAFSVVAHAPYSVSPALFREVARRANGRTLSVHLGESPEEIAFLRTGGGPIRETLEELGVWTDAWQVPACDPVTYIDDLGYLQPGMLAVHCVHLRDDALARLEKTGGIIVTCPRSNEWVGAGMPHVSHFYASRARVAIGTDSLASAASLNMFDELAELRRIAPDVTAASLLESATRVGAEALGFGRHYGTLAHGKRASVVAVSVPAGLTDVEEYLVSSVPASDVRPVSL